ncbi:Uncharacterised protein [Klebsiella pneumoniae]|uniref:Uncharacterized protein n=1 Tax=Klebsiella pneumoniae TaxID=573 RepID=A0A3S4KJR8_KLEPN|nr:Uncharacterised protein [Klebsiella pneumoniae]
MLNLALNVFSTAGTQDIDQTGLVDIAVDDLGANFIADNKAVSSPVAWENSCCFSNNKLT